MYLAAVRQWREKGEQNIHAKQKKSCQNYRHGLAKWLHRIACLAGNFGSGFQMAGKREKITPTK
jgi:hypothetical protein